MARSDLPIRLGSLHPTSRACDDTVITFIFRREVPTLSWLDCLVAPQPKSIHTLTATTRLVLVIRVDQRGYVPVNKACLPSSITTSMPQKVPAETIHNRTSEWVSSLRSKPRRHRASKSQDVSKPMPAPAAVPPLYVPPLETYNLGARTARARSPIATNQSDPCPEFTDEVVILQNGSEPGASSVSIRKELLDNATSLFRGTSEPRIISVKTEPLIFKMFINWLNRPEDPVPFLPCHYSREPWRSRAVDAWFFATKICAPGFEMCALSHIIRNCSMQDSGYFAQIERKANAKSALLRFSNHWVAWNVYFALEGHSEYRELAAAKLANVVNGDTNDPRIYEIEHWYSLCGDNINSSCNHDPIVRENAVNALSASRRPKPTWGFKWEAEHQPSQEKEVPPSPTLKAQKLNITVKMNSPPPLPPRTIKPRLPPRPKSR